jgi:hypothetical protein
MVENAVMASEKNDLQAMVSIGLLLEESIRAAMSQTEAGDQ